jgi:hypothetical protein
MKFVLVEQVDEPAASERKLSDAIFETIRPIGYKVSAIMDEVEVTKYITGVEQIAKGSAPLRIRRQCPGPRNQQQQASDRWQHILVSIAVFVAAVVLTILYSCTK